MNLALLIVMAEFIFQPTDFQAARVALQNKMILPTTLGSAQIAATWPAELRAASFFSAQTARDDVLAEFQLEVQALMNLLAPVDDVVRGNDLASARLRLQNFLVDAGWQRPEGVEPGTLADLASARRIDLILNTQVQQAYAVGAYRQQQTPEAKALYPYLRYIGDPRPTRRPEHWKLNGLILPKDHSFWRTHTPPWDYNCFCAVEEVSQEEADKEGVAEAASGADRTIVSRNGQSWEVPAVTSGYSFDPALGLKESA
jgi:hypothetical protein